MAVGKSTVAKALAEKLPHSVYFDGDWAWDIHPFTVSDENIQMVHENIAFMLNQFLRNSQIEHVIFTWVMQEQGIIDQVLSDLTGNDFQLFNISLMADEATLRAHFTDDPKRDENGENMAKALSYLAKYEKLDSIKLDRTGKSSDESVGEILELMKEVRK